MMATPGLGISETRMSGDVRDTAAHPTAIMATAGAVKLEYLRQTSIAGVLHDIAHNPAIAQFCKNQEMGNSINFAEVLEP